ncbi:MAG: hypothetical protein IJ746_05645 [Ruminococcus sp.]|nr:hypothetical protein [Ruminococcus sp.]
MALFGDKSYRIDLAFGCDVNTVFNAVLQGAPAAGFSVVNTDPANGVINLTKGMSLWTWGENITVYLGVLPDSRTGLTIVSAPKLGTEFGASSQNRKNAEQLANQLCMMLPGQPMYPSGQPTYPQTPQGPQ